MSIRTTLAATNRMARMDKSRGTVREFDDKHLIQEIKADVFHSETHSKVERFQIVGISSKPLKQFKEKQQQQKKKQQQQQSKDGWNHDQPKGKAAEAVLLYLNGDRAHAIAMVDDRRVRPYNLKEGDAVLYHASGTEQKVYMSDGGAYLLANNNKSEEEDSQEKERIASLRHVNLAKQKHEIKDDEQVKDHNHEGDSVNTEVRCVKDRIEFYAPGDKKVGLYDKSAKRWFFDVDAAGNVTFEMTISKITAKVGKSKVEIEGGKITFTSSEIDHVKA